MKVWLLSIGEYSDYRILSVFDEEHKKEAEELAELIGGELEENHFVLNKLPDYDIPPKGMRFFRMKMKRNGGIVFCTEGAVLNEFGSSHKCDYLLDESKNGRRWRLFVNNYAKDKKHMIKTTNDIRVRILAGSLPKEGSLGLEK